MKQMMLGLLLMFAPITSYSMEMTREDLQDFERLLQQREQQSNDSTERLRHKQLDDRETEEETSGQNCPRILVTILSFLWQNRGSYRTHDHNPS